MKRRAVLSLTSLLLLLPFLLTVAPAHAMESVQIALEAGTTDLEVGGKQIRIETTGAVEVTLRVDGDVVEGSVRSAPGTRSATVTITVLGSPDRVIFRGRIRGEQIFREYLPHQETGQGEM